MMDDDRSNEPSVVVATKQQRHHPNPKIAVRGVALDKTNQHEISHPLYPRVVGAKFVTPTFPNSFSTAIDLSL
jgi:hypothetical protein